MPKIMIERQCIRLAADRVKAALFALSLQLAGAAAWAQDSAVEPGAVPHAVTTTPPPPPPPPPPPWNAYFTDSRLWIWAGVAAIAAYLLSFVVTLVLSAKVFPPNAARAGSWIGLTAWILFIVFYLYGRILPAELPLGLVALALLLILIFGLVLYSGRRQPVG